MSVASEVVFTVNHAFESGIMVHCRNPGVFRVSGSVVPINFVFTTVGATTLCSSGSMVVPMGESLMFIGLDPSLHVSRGKKDLVVVQVAPSGGESRMAVVIIHIVVTVSLSSHSVISSGMPSVTPLDSTNESPSKSIDVLERGDKSTLPID